IVYDVDIRLNGASVYKAADVEHYPYSNWRRLLWTDNQPSLRIVPDLATLQAAAAVPQYDPKFRVDGDLLRDLADEVRELGDEPLSHAMITRYMPSSGGRMDIGPLPTWAAVDLLAGDATTRRALLANADAAGAAPWHIREKATGKALTIDKYPNLWLDSRGKDPAPLPQSFHEESYGWTLDDAHQPSLTYLPYLITGLQYYRDELTQQAAYVLLSYDAGYRGGASGLIIGENGQAWQQVRGMAW